MNILNDVLDYSKAEAGRMELEVVTVDLLELLDDVNVLYREHFRRKSLDFYTFIEAGTPLSFKSDPTRLKQIVGNLVNNAVKFTERGQVSILVRPHATRADCVEFLIQDTGIGIAPEHASQLFDRFRQADSSISRRYGGTGLGLAISKRLIELLGGRIDVRTEPGAGATFTFCISAPAIERAAIPGIDPSARVFLVSDDAELARSIGLVMSRWVGSFVVLEDVDELEAHMPTEHDRVILDETCVEPNPDIDATYVAWIGEGFDAGTALARPVLFAQLERLLQSAADVSNRQNRAASTRGSRRSGGGRQSNESTRRRQDAQQLGRNGALRRKRSGSDRDVRQPRQRHRRSADGLRNARDGWVLRHPPHPHAGAFRPSCLDPDHRANGPRNAGIQASRRGSGNDRLRHQTDPENDAAESDVERARHGAVRRR